jgi:hypothetical protein
MPFDSVLDLVGVPSTVLSDGGFSTAEAKHLPDINEQCWQVIGALGANEHSYLSPAAVERLTEMGIVEADSKGKPRLTAYGERAYARARIR